MAIDMSQFHQIFFEETGEHLATLENLLLTLDVAAPDPEQLNAVFRAAHSIKGSSGTFGFNDLAEVTHILENLLDRIRKSKLRLNEEMIAVFLDARDVLQGMLAAHQGSGVADLAAAALICQRLSALSGESACAPPPGAVPAAGHSVPPVPGGFPPVTPTIAGSGTPPALAATGCELYFVLAGDADSAERLIDNLLTELGGLGEVRIVEGAASAGQPWHLRLLGAADITTLRALLEFVARSDSIRIEPLSLSAAALLDSPAAAYGFFEPLADSLVSAAQPAVPATLPIVEEAYGFFEPLPPLPVAATPEAVPTLVTKAAAAAADATIRVGVDKVDQLINLVGELVITQAMLMQSTAQLDPAEFERLHNGMVQLERNTRDLQEAVMSIRMLPVSVVFARFPRLVHDLAQKFGKRVELKLSGEDTELDKNLIERIADPLTHLVRNSLDHGIESPAVRAAMGKQPVGTITLKAYHQGGNVVIEVGDDGAGLNRARILAKAKERGCGVHEQMSDQEVFQLIFEAGFSTAETVTEVSGRGVGMDVVRRNIAALGGRVVIESMSGIGTRMTVRLPLTLAILDGMSVAVGREMYIVPLGYVIESMQVERSMIKSVAGVAKLIQVRDEYLPVVALHEIFRVPGAATAFEAGIMIILEADGRKAALLVDAMVGQHQVVIKSLESNYRKVPGVSAATIMGDGRVALILDVSMLVSMARSALPAAA
ncbi:MAG: chemotaxis protein CheW [Gammaproteobacteria bacterium]|nr:chemotaxis protein CheA [Rhodocyclaceae bacterium]MBU3910486.1 chemotaxis protein CheW [Gammaproteobacteria bacterium]MBU3989612.1 chemotaxis protein CheW [Gammaproteobacteria bacterium]MBU4004967.1 chemotaxis protein CheW [Gammaproteobacteria bacterium]MBU4020560.1 chemotaxis protein CheW [Gammaproteobacteria bacterium]